MAIDRLAAALVLNALISKTGFDVTSIDTAKLIESLDSNTSLKKPKEG